MINFCAGGAGRGPLWSYLRLPEEYFLETIKLK